MRLTAVGVSPKPQRPTLTEGGRDASAAIKSHRPVWFSEANGFAPSPVLDRSTLCAGNVVAGPAVIEELDATTVVHPGWEAHVDAQGNLLLGRVMTRQPLLSPGRPG